jgi:hypothetical protein
MGGSTILTLPSNCSLEKYPSNVTSDYKVELPQPIELADGQYEVGLTGFQYPRTWYNFNTQSAYTAVYHMATAEEGQPLPKCLDTSDRDPGPDDADDSRVARSLYRSKRVVVPAGHYMDIQQVLNILNDVRVKTAATFVYREEREKVSLHFRPGLKSCRYTVRLSAALAEKLGWPREETIITGGREQVFEAPGVIKLDSIDLIFVHCDLAADSHIVGDIKTALMRVVPVAGRHGSVMAYEPRRVDWLPVRWTQFRTLRVLITDSFGEKIPFERGVCAVKLLLRRHSPFDD